MSGNSTLWINIKICCFKSFPLMYIKYIPSKIQGIGCQQSICFSGTRTDLAYFQAVLSLWICPMTATTCSCLKEWLHTRNIHVLRKGRLTNEHSKIPDPGTTDSKVLNIRDTYARGDMHNGAVE